MECLTFKAAGRHLGIEIRYIHRVVDEFTITPVPLLPSCHLGLLYYRGELFDVIDLGNLLEERKDVKPGAVGKNHRIILLKWNQKNLALVPDEIIGLNRVEDRKEEDGFNSQGELKIELITPDHIWEMLSGLSYGYGKV